MKIYRCKMTLRVEQYDDNGCWQPCKQIEVKPGTVLQESRQPLQIASAPCIRLENKEIWIEVMPETLAEHFEELT